MNPTDWIEIKPGCEMPKDGELVLAICRTTGCKLAVHCCGEYSANFRLDNGYYISHATHWQRIVPPLKPDPFEEFYRVRMKQPGTGYQKDVYRDFWNAAIEHARKEGK